VKYVSDSLGIGASRGNVGSRTFGRMAFYFVRGIYWFNYKPTAGHFASIIFMPRVVLFICHALPRNLRNCRDIIDNKRLFKVVILKLK